MTKTWQPPVEERYLLQGNNFINSSGHMVIAIIFYKFAILWLVSYLRLIFTDIKSDNYIQIEDLEPGRQLRICEECQIVKRRDIVHCTDCNVCTEFYDHHCGVFQVCVAGKTYKFFILVFVHFIT